MTDLVNKLSILIQNQIPDFVKENYETFIAFIRAYYSYLEQEGKAQYVIQNARDYADVDKTIDDFVDNFVKEYAATLPRTFFSLASNDQKRLFVKYASDMYRAKGSEDAYKLLFRLLFDEEINFYYPSELVLKPSDGTWTRRQSIKVTESVSSNINLSAGRLVEGADSGATAVVDFVLNYQEDGFFIHELVLQPDTLNGTFIAGEPFACGSCNVLGVISSFDIVDGGLGYEANTSVNITGSGVGAIASIEAVDESGKILDIRLSKPGVGYDANTVVSVGSPTAVKTGTYDLTSNVATIALTSKHGLTVGDNINVQFTSGGATSNVYTVADIINLKAFSFPLVQANTSGNVSISYLNNANIQVSVTGIVNYEGTYGDDTKGRLDDRIRIQDSEFYQQFSYVIRSNIPIDQWRDIVKTVLHPAGMALYGELFVSQQTGGEQSIYVGPVEGPHPFLYLLKLLITSTEVKVTLNQQDVVLHYSPNISILDSKTTLGPSFETIAKFKFDYEDNTPISLFETYTIDFFEQTQNLNSSTNYAPPNSVVLESV